MTSSETETRTDPFAGKRPRCTHCGRRVARNSRSAILHADGTSSEYCAHRAACRRAEHDSITTQGHLHLPYSSDDLATETMGAALIAADYIPMPRWARLVPQAWWDRLWRAAAVQIGGAVQSSVLERRKNGPESMRGRYALSDTPPADFLDDARAEG